MQLPDGRFADASGLAVLDTSEALLALTAVAPGSAAIGNGRFALLLARPGSLDLEARRLGAICDRGLAFGLSLAEDALASDGGLGDAPGAGVASVYATASFVEQLSRCGEGELSRLSRAAQALQLLQHPDGGFGLSGDDSTVEVTAIATLALAPVAGLLGAEPSVAAGAAFLLAAQLPGGAFGSGSANDTALSLLALAAAGADPSRIEQGVVALEAMQALDGSFGSVRSTALAARALGASRPDLRIDAGGITEAAPLVPGELGTVTVRVINGGASPARVRVGLFAGDPLAGAPRLGTSTPVDVPVGGLALATVEFLPGAVGSLPVVAWVDDDAVVAETDEPNNLRAAILAVQPRVALTVLAPTFTPEVPAAQDSIVVRVPVRNGGARSAGPFAVQLLEGGGAAAPQVVIPGLAAGATAEATFALGTLAYGVHDLTAVAIPPEAGDPDLTDDRRDFQLDVRTRVDLVVSTIGVEVSGQAIHEGTPVHLRAHIRNAGTEAAGATTVRFHDGDPAAGGPVLGELPLAPLAGGGFATVGSVSFLTAGRPGLNPIHVVVDPDNLIAETNEQNSAVATIDVLVTGDPAFLASDVTMTPALPIQGDVMEFHYSPRNLGSAVSGSFGFRAEIIDPTGHALAVGIPRASLKLAAGQFMPSQIARFTAVEPGRHVFRATLAMLPAAGSEQVTTANDVVEIPFDVAPSPVADLSILTSDIQVTPAAPLDGDLATVVLRVENRWGPDAVAVVRLYAGEPSLGDALGEAIVTVPGGGNSDASILWNTTGRAGSVELVAVVDPAGLVAESREDNNEARVLVDVLAPGDLDPTGLTVTEIAADALRLDWTEGPGASPATIRGYRVMRDGAWINPPINMAITATVSATSFQSAGFDAAAARDGSPNFGWYPAGADTAPVWTATFPAIEVEQVAFSFGLNWVPSAYVVELHVGGVWQPTVTVAGNTTQERVHSFPPVICDGLRYVHGAGRIGIQEVAVYSSRLATGPTFTDSPLAPGTHTYAVRAQALGGGPSARSNEVEASLGDVTPPPAPASLTRSLTGTTVSLSWPGVVAADLAGYRVYRTDQNGAERGRLSALISGDFNASTLFDGTATSSSLGNGEIDGFFAVAKFGQRSEVTAVELVTAAPETTFTYRIELSDDGVHWTTVSDRTAGRNSLRSDYLELGPPVFARYVRLADGRAENGNFRAVELKAYVRERQPLTPATPLLFNPTDTVLAPLQRITTNSVTTSSVARRMTFLGGSLGERPLLVSDATTGKALLALDGSFDAVVTRPLRATTYRQALEAGIDGGVVTLGGPLTLPLQTSTTRTDTPLFNANYIYDVVAVDTAGNESTPVAAAPLPFAFTPGLVSNLRATAGDHEVTLTWSTASIPILDGYEVYRAGEAEPIAFVVQGGADLTGLPNRVLHCFEVAIRTVQGTVGPRAGPICATPLSDDLTIEGRFGAPTLSSMPATPAVGQPAMLIAVVQQDGSDDVSTVVRFFDGAPEAGGILIGQTTVLVSGHGQALAAMPWTPAGAPGPRSIVAIADPDAALPELDETDNRASALITVAPSPILEVGLLSLDAAAFPAVAAHLSVRDSSGLPATGLVLGDLVTLENGAAARLISLQERYQPAGLRRMDVVFAFDTSGSMLAEGQEVCDLIDELTFRLSVEGVDLQVTGRAITDGNAQFAPCLTSMRTGTYQGQPIPLSREDWGPATTWLAANHAWRPGATRIVIPVSDEGAYDGDPSNSGDEASILEAIAACQAAGVVTYPLYSELSPGSGFVTPGVIAQATALAQGTGGVANLFQTGAGLSDQLVGLFVREAADYVATFESPEPARDGSLRGVGISASWRGLSGSSSGSYLAPLSPFDASLADAAVAVSALPSAPTVGEAVTLTARLRNLGGAAATVPVRFFDGDPTAGGTQIGNDLAVSLLAGGSGEATTTWTATAGSHLIWAVVDPDGLVPEGDDANNAGFAAVLVPGAVQPDLFVTNTGLRLTPASPRTGAAVTVEVDVSARAGDFLDVAVAVFLGEPGAGGTWVSTASLPLVRAGETASASVVVAAPEAGEREVWVLVDPVGIQAQATTGNDRAHAGFTVLPADVGLSVATDHPSYPAQTDALVGVDVLNTQGVAVGGAGTLSLVADAGGGPQLVSTFSVADLPSRPALGYAYRIPATVAVSGLPTQDVLAGAEVDFTAALQAVGAPGAAFDFAAVRVFERDSATGAVLGERAVAFEPAPGFDPVAAAIGTVRWYVPGQLGATARSFEIVFDRAERGPFPPSPAGALPFSDAIVVWRPASPWGVRAETRTPTGVTSPVQVLADTQLSGILTMGAGDFDGDGLTDLIEAGFPAGPNGLYRTHFGSFGPSGWSLSAGLPWGATGMGIVDFIRMYQGFVPADVNHDGHLDFAVSDMGGSINGLLNVAYGRGDGTFALVEHAAPDGRIFTEHSLADVNEDGEFDLIRSGAQLKVYLATAPGTFDAGAVVDPASAGFGNAVADFDEDGHLDVAFATNTPVSALRLVRGNGDGTFRPSTQVAGITASYWWDIDAADLDGDGHLDLVVSRPTAVGSQFADALVLHRGNGDGTFGPDEVLVTDPNLQQSEIVGARRRVEAVVGPAEAGPGARFDFVISTADLAPGPYQVVADLELADGTLASGTTPIVIEPTRHPVLTVLTEAVEYGSSDPVTVRTRLSNPDANTPLEGTLHLTATAASGTILYEVSDPVGPIAIDGQDTRHTTFTLAGVAHGAHRVRAELLDAGGAILVSAEGPLVVRSDLAEDGLSATIEVPAEVAIGADFTATATLAAVGNTDYPAADVELSLVSVATGVSVASVSGLHDLLRAAGPIEIPATFATATLAAGPYLVVVSVNGEPLASSAVDLVSPTGTEPPEIVVTGVTSGHLGRDDVTPVITIVGATSETVTLDGAAFVSGTAVVTEGDHVLEVVASNTFGTSTVVVTFTIDRTPPAVSIDGVADGAVACAPVFVSATATDANGTDAATLTLDGVPYPAFSPIFGAGPHVIVAETTDFAGNVGSATAAFQLDSEPPLVAVSGVSEGLVAQGPVSIAWTIVEEHPNLGATYATLDGAPFAGGSVNAEGAHVLVVHAEDLACGVTEVTVHFVLDRTPPALTLSGVASGAIVCGPVAVDLAVVEANPAGPPPLTLDGLPYAALSPIAAEGPHTVEASALDLAGNSGTATLAFIVDNSAPGITIAGVAEGLVTRLPVTPSWTITEAHLDAAATFATLDGTPAASGTPVATEGDHALVVHAEDLACGVAEATVHFAIDTIPPVLSLSGVTDGAFYAAPVAGTLIVSDLHLATTSLLLDGAPYTSGSPIGAEGDHVLVAHAEDAAGNVADLSVSFVLDFTAPAVSLAGVADGEITCGPVLVSASVTDQHLGGAPTLTLDGLPYAALSPISAEGAHVVEASALDLAGNSGTASVSFTVDSSAPTIVVAGVTEGLVSGTPLAPSWTIAEAHLDPAATFATLDGAQFVSGATVAADGDHTLVVHAEDLACGVAEATVHFAIDATPPQLSLTGVTDGAFYSGPVAATLVVSDPHLVSMSLLLDGAPYTSGSPISAEGTHTLVAHAEDAAGNSSDLSVSIVLDFTAPVVTLAGVADGEFTCGPLLLSGSATDLNPGGAPTLTLDGAPYTPGSPVVGDGVHMVVAIAQDLAGNTGTASITFTLDTTPPTIEVAGVTAGALVSSAVTVSFAITELHPDPAATFVTLDGAPFSSGSTIATEGSHTLIVHAEDLACGVAETLVHFAIDSTPPAISITGVTDGAFYNAPVAATVAITDLHLVPGATSILLDGVAYLSGTPISSEGSHTLSVHAEDGAGNAADATVSFVLDTTAPAVALSGVNEGDITCGPVAVGATASDANLAGPPTLTLDGAAYLAFDPIAADGDHLVEAHAGDLAGNTGTASRAFTIDTVAPQVALSGVSEGLLAHGPVTPVWTITDLHLDAAATYATLDGLPFTSGTAVSGQGDHVLVIHAEDLACGATETITHFTLDATPPVIEVSGVMDGAYTAGDVTIIVTVTDAHPGPAATVLLDGLPYVTGTAISAEGAHTLAVRAEDGAGNTADRTVSFVIDGTAPVVTLAGIAEASITCGPVAVSVSSTDANAAGSATVTLDGLPYAQGSPITSEGAHVVSALAADLAGNTAQAELHFTIDVTPPVVTVSGVSEGLLTNPPVAPVVTVTDAHLRPDTVTLLDGAPFVSGTSVTSDGDHALFVHAEDLACGVTETTVHFTIDATPPSIVVAGVEEAAYYAAPVAATVTISDLHLTVTHTLLDGAPYASGTPIASEGPHVLTIHAEDGAGNSADRTISFNLDFTAPVIAIAGVEDGGICTGTVVATLSASDASPVTITSTLDGAPYSSGTAISGNGPHLLEVTAIDAAGNEAHAFAAFELRTAVPDFRFGLCSTRGTSFENSASVVSAGAPATLVSAAGNLSMKHSSRIWGDAVVGADLSMRNSARITGTASIAGAATFLNSSGVGALVHLSAPPEVCTCGFDATTAMADAAASNDNALLAGVVALTAGRLELTHREAVLLPAGRYYVTGLTLEHQATLGPAPGAAVELYVDGAISVRNLSVLGDPGGDPTRFLVVSTAGPPTGTAVLFENNTAVGLRLYAPDADVTIDNSSEVVGGIVGGSLLVRNNGQLISTNSSSGADALVCP